MSALEKQVTTHCVWRISRWDSFLHEWCYRSNSGNYGKTTLAGHQIQCRDVKLKKNVAVGLGVIVYGQYLDPVDYERLLK